MSRRHSNNNTVPTPEYGWEEIARITQTDVETTIAIPEYYTKVGFFIVAGGGGGAGDYSKSDCPGQGGNGGEVNAIIVNNVLSSAIVKVGVGGTRGNNKTPPNNQANGRTFGGDSYVIYNGMTYTSTGGYYGGYGTTGFGNPNILQPGNRGIGGFGAVLNHYPGYDDFADYIWNGKAGEGEDFDLTHSNTYHIHGGNGYHNPFDVFDNTLYGAGGGGGCDSYRGYTYIKTHFGEGGETGGGNGGYGSNNFLSNTGLSAIYYGGGGGGAAFSSSHTYGIGGNGKQGIVIIYGIQ